MHSDPTLPVPRGRSDGALPALLDAIAGWVSRHRLASDVSLVGFLAVLTSWDAVHRGSWAVLAFQAALWLPLIFRRNAPVAAFVLVGLVAALQWAVGVPPVGGDIAVLVVLYTVAAHRGRPVGVAAALAVQVGVVVAVARFAGAGWPRFLLLLTIVLWAAALLGITQQARRSHLAALVDRAARLERAAEGQTALATAAERTRIAREMHDIVAHSLSVMVALADGAALTQQPEQARAAMAQVARTGRDALADTRRVLGILRTDPDPADRAPLPGLDSLEALLITVRATGLRTSLLVTGTVFALPAAAQTAVYRIVQEGLTNIVKHADQADRATVTLTYRHPQIGIDVTDNGVHRWTAPRTRPAPDAHGLLGITERAALFGGTARAGWGTNGGWRITAALQLTGAAEPPTGRANGDAAHRPAPDLGDGR